MQPSMTHPLPSPTLADQGPAARALGMLLDTHAGLPAVTWEISRHCPAELRLIVDDAAQWEAWRAALGLSPKTVELDARLGMLRARGTWCDAAVDLAAYGLGLAMDLTALHDALPLEDPDRHALEDPGMEAAWARLAPGHPAALTAAGVTA